MSDVAQRPWGVMAEFATADALLAAARRLRDAGHTRLEAYAPFHVEGLAEAVGCRRTHLSLITLLGAVAGGGAAWLMQWYSAAVDYALNVGGRPLASWPMFVPVTFELTILVASLAAVLGLLALNGLPMPYHPVFNVERFEFATRNRFFLCIEASDAKFDAATTRRFLESLSPAGVYEVEH